MDWRNELLRQCQQHLCLEGKCEDANNSEYQKMAPIIFNNMEQSIIGTCLGGNVTQQFKCIDRKESINPTNKQKLTRTRHTCSTKGIGRNR